MALAPAPPAGAASAAAAAAPAGVEEQEIVVTATRKGKCRIQRADQTLSDRQFDKSAGEWASLGTPVRVVTPTRADYKCLAKIVFRLNDRGVRLIQFVDRPAPPQSDLKSGGTADDSEITANKRKLNAIPVQ